MVEEQILYSAFPSTEITNGALGIDMTHFIWDLTYVINLPASFYERFIRLQLQACGTPEISVT
jgi:hypothetical protein